MTTSRSSARIASRIRWLSARLCTGLPLSISIARKRSGWGGSVASPRISSGMMLHGTSPVTRRCPVTGVTRSARGPPAPSEPPPPREANRVCRFMPPGTPKLPVSSISSFSSQLFSVECGAIWMPRSSKIDTPPCAPASTLAAWRTSASGTPALAA